MANIKIQDGANEFRISLTGRFAGASVQEVRRTWTKKLAECSSSRLKVDISELSDYDGAGRKLLRDMYRHGIDFAASTPASLVFLSEISSPRRGPITMLSQHTDRGISDRAISTPEPDTAARVEKFPVPKVRAAGK